MIDLTKAQKEVLENKKEKGFNTTDMAVEFCLAHEELSEAYQAYYKKLPDLGEELADVAIYLMSIAEINNIDLESEIKNKIEKNKRRKYEMIDGVMTRVSEE